jgi:hypothetical protein
MKISSSSYTIMSYAHTGIGPMLGTTYVRDMLNFSVCLFANRSSIQMYKQQTQTCMNILIISPLAVRFQVITAAHSLFIALMMEAVCTSETSVYYNENTWRYIPQGSNLHPFKGFK